MENNTVDKFDNTGAWYNVLKPTWYVEQMKGWSFPSYMLLMFGLGAIIGMTAASGINGISILKSFFPIVSFQSFDLLIHEYR